MIAPNLLIACGTLLIAIGGIIATNGWNARTSVAQRRSIIRAVAAESLMNMYVYKDKKFTEEIEDQLVKFTLFPRMQTSALEGAIASALFTGEKDRTFLTRASRLNERLSDFNQRLSFTEERMSQKSSDIALYRKKLRYGQVRKTLGVELQKFGQLLMTDYGIKRDDRFFVKLDD
jgi:hypothetical protein